MSTLFRHLPSVGQILEALGGDGDIAALPRPLVKDLVNEFLEICREEIRQNAIVHEDALALDTLCLLYTSPSLRD